MKLVNVNPEALLYPTSNEVDSTEWLQTIHKNSIKFMIIMALSFCLLSIVQYLDLPRTSLSTWSQQTKKEQLILLESQNHHIQKLS
jgi:hypothetical protein